MVQKFALISDIHGNVWALENVIKDIIDRGIENLINLGDILYGPFDPQRTTELLKDFCMLSIQGNQDRLIYENIDTPSENPTLEYVLKHLSEDQIRWLETLPKTRVVAGELFLCHGTPLNDESYLLEDISQGTPRLKTNSELNHLLESIEQLVVVCGHSHIQGTVQLPNGKLIVNPGSVGLPAYTDDLPIFHKMESRCPHASYSILSSSDAGWKVEQIKIPYDWEKAAEEASKNHREDWAKWIKTGKD
jgi:putative phosphoesterase